MELTDNHIEILKMANTNPDNYINANNIYDARALLDLLHEYKNNHKFRALCRIEAQHHKDPKMRRLLLYLDISM